MDVTRYRFPEKARLAAMVVGGLATLAIVVLGVADRFKDVAGWSFVLAGLAFAGVVVALERQAMQVKLSELTLERRKLAVDLAWRRLVVPDLTSWKWGLGAAIACIAVFSLGVYAGVGPRVVMVLVAAVIPAGLAFGRAKFAQWPFADRHGLRASGVEYVRSMTRAWLSKGGEQEGERAVARFGLRDAGKTWFIFWPPMTPTPATPDMPPATVDYHVLAVGEFVGQREGAFIDLRATSLAHAEQQNPDEVKRELIALGKDSAKVEEREAHYRDIVTVDYKRGGDAKGALIGVFQVSLTNGQTIAFPTEEEGTPITSALDYIRQRTRQVKAAS